MKGCLSRAAKQIIQPTHNASIAAGDHCYQTWLMARKASAWCTVTPWFTLTKIRLKGAKHARSVHHMMHKVSVTKSSGIQSRSLAQFQWSLELIAICQPWISTVSVLHDGELNRKQNEITSSVMPTMYESVIVLHRAMLRRLPLSSRCLFSTGSQSCEQLLCTWKLERWMLSEDLQLMTK